eukprot:15442938-Alexandrium_andersonii.AAC.1
MSASSCSSCRPSRPSILSAACTRACRQTLTPCVASSDCRGDGVLTHGAGCAVACLASPCTASNS